MANYNLTQTGDEVQAYIDSIPVIDVTGTLSGSTITFGSNPYSQIAANYAADCSSIVRLTVGTSVYLLRVTQYDGTTYTAAEMSGAHNVVATIGSSSASATIDAGIDTTPTQNSNNLITSGAVAVLKQEVNGIANSVGASSTSSSFTLNDMTKEVGYYISSTGKKTATAATWEIYSLSVDCSQGSVSATLGANTASYIAIALYNSETIGSDSLIGSVNTKNSASYSVSLTIPSTCKLLVICNRNASNAAPTASITVETYQSALTLRIDNLQEEIDELAEEIEGTPLELVQGGIDTGGHEIASSKRVRSGYLESPFTIEANSGYQIYYLYYFDAVTKAFISSTAGSGLSKFSYAGDYLMRLVFAKTDSNENITPIEAIVKSYTGGMKESISAVPKVDVIADLASIPSAADSTLCFFKGIDRNGIWSDGYLWREIVGNYLFITGTSYRTIKISDGAVVSGHNADEIVNISSVTKLMTLVVTCDNVANYSENVTIIAADIVNSGVGHYVQQGDVTTIGALMAAAVVVSDNNAAMALQRVVGYKINPSAATDTAARNAFNNSMNTKAAALSMSNTTYNSPLTNCMSSAADQCLLLKAIQDNYSDICSLWGLLTYSMVITGTNARTYQITSTVSSAARVVIPEFVGGKTGTGDNLGKLAFIWKDANNVYYASMVLNSLTTGLVRFEDARRVIDEAYEIIS